VEETGRGCFSFCSCSPTSRGTTSRAPSVQVRILPRVPVFRYQVRSAKYQVKARAPNLTPGT
jgi:hypothetical protein